MFLFQPRMLFWVEHLHFCDQTKLHNKSGKSGTSHSLLNALPGIKLFLQMIPAKQCQNFLCRIPVRKLPEVTPAKPEYGAICNPSDWLNFSSNLGGTRDRCDLASLGNSGRRKAEGQEGTEHQNDFCLQKITQVDEYFS